MKKKHALPALCAVCVKYVTDRIDAGSSGIIFCDHPPTNTPGAGMLAIVRVKNRTLLSLDLHWPKKENVATDLMDRVEHDVAALGTKH